MKVAVLGATGMLGSMLVDYLSKYFDVVATVRSKDYKPPANVEVKYLEATENQKLPEVLRGCQWAINAIGAIPQRVSDYREFNLLNIHFPRWLARVAVEMSCRVIQIATDCIYSGDEGNYTELSKTSLPHGVYGVTKWLGEKMMPNMHYIRCSIIGPEAHGKSLLGWFLSQPEGATINGYNNHYWNGVTTLHFAKVCRGIIEKRITLPHLQHLVPADSVSKHKLLQLFAREFGREDIIINSMVTVQKVDRRLATANPALNRELWQAAGYDFPPTIEKMVKELGV